MPLNMVSMAIYVTLEGKIPRTPIRELAIATLGKYRIVWGGHPSITPMIKSLCKDLNVDYAKSTLLYQSNFFKPFFPKDNEFFDNAIIVDEVKGDREASIELMRKKMLSRENIKIAVFIGGMEGIEDEFNMFKKFHPDGISVFLGAPGGAARDLAMKEYGLKSQQVNSIDFHKIINDVLVVMGHKERLNNSIQLTKRINKFSMGRVSLGSNLRLTNNPKGIKVKKLKK